MPQTSCVFSIFFLADSNELRCLPVLSARAVFGFVAFVFFAAGISITSKQNTPKTSRGLL
jgi:hypothetical protein